VLDLAEPQEPDLMEVSEATVPMAQEEEAEVIAAQETGVGVQEEPGVQREPTQQG